MKWFLRDFKDNILPALIVSVVYGLLVALAISLAMLALASNASGACEPGQECWNQYSATATVLASYPTPVPPSPICSPKDECNYTYIPYASNMFTWASSGPPPER